MSINGNFGFSKAWYLVLLKPNGLARAQTNLHRQGVSTFMPLYSQPSQNRRGSAPKPLFPGYLFVHFNPQATSFATVNSTFGVSYIVTAGCDIKRGLPSELIEGLRARCDTQGHLLPLASLKVNETVRITAGPFSQFVAVVDKLKTPERVQILFEMMGQTIRSEIAVDDLERLTQSKKSMYFLTMCQ